MRSRSLNLSSDVAQGSRLKALGKDTPRHPSRTTTHVIFAKQTAFSLEPPAFSPPRTLKLTIAYDGTRYAGWQVQKGSDKRQATSNTKPTIQGTLERVFQRILQESVKVIGSGRTDAGVHAQAQVAHVKIQSTIPRERLLRSLNQLLPPDIAITKIEEAPAPFHARFDVSGKRYRYRIFTGTVVPPFVRPYVYHVRTRLNVSLIRREAMCLRGRHNFRAFARTGGPSRTTVRAITDIRILQRRDEMQIEVASTGFLHTMVRSIVGTLLDIGRGHLSPGTIHRMLRSGNRQLAGTTAPASGLTLVSVEYRRTDG